MIISREKKENNIAEYVIYMWQIEDLIRAYNLNLINIEAEIISQFNLEQDKHIEMVEWYDNLIQLMLNEKVVEKGHIQFLKNIVDDLTIFHLSLLKSSHHKQYQEEFEKMLPFLSDLLKKIKDKDKSLIEVCFETLYGILMLRLKKQEISKETQEATTQISNLISILSTKYHQSEQDPDFII